MLQARIVGTKEVIRDWELLWLPSVRSEFNSLFNDKIEVGQRAVQDLEKKSLGGGKVH